MKLVEKQPKHYQILDKLGEGSLGFFYKALDTKLARKMLERVCGC